ncbi:uncharacterized protein [Diabrotica undecimpunctata]|uniref:uncharacterized protein n=1 Tax=Diabrotica undecimpunctata TaxID=50387 RepID=UPI003B63B4EF
MANLIQIEYNFNNTIYKIVESEEVHNLLEDPEYFEKYCQENRNEIEISVENLDVENIPPTVNVPVPFSWSIKTTKLLLSCYNEKKELFRNPKIKKRQVWGQIVKIFQSHGYNISHEILDKKFRNMKAHFKTVKDNAKKSKTGQGTVGWEYFEDMEAIFVDDKTINTDEIIISSMSMAMPKEIKELGELLDAPNEKVTNLEPQPGTSGCGIKVGAFRILRHSNLAKLLYDS